MIFQYFLRAKTSEYPQLVDLLKSLGVVAEYLNEDGSTRIGEIPPSNFDYRGELYEGTGVFNTVDGMPVEQKRLIVDASGEPYQHCNILVRTDLKEALRYSPFVLQDEDGYPRSPKNPACVFILTQG